MLSAIAPPLAISIDPDDPNYRADHDQFVIILDGERVPFPISADAKTGVVTFEPTDETGWPFHDGVQFVRVQRKDHVEIVSVEVWNKGCR